MARKALVELIGDPSSLLRSFRQSSNGAQKLERDLKGLAVTAKQSAEAQIQAAVKRDARLRQEIVAYRQIASAAKKGSTEQVIAARKAAEAESRLSRSLGVTAREQRALATSAARTERQLGRATRGTLAGSGALRSMGRSLAFASAGFLSFAIAAQALRSSITAASDLTEEINKSNVVFRGSEKQVQSWSKTLIPAFGLTRAEALQTAGTFGNMLVPMGFVRRRAAEMSERLVELAGDMASFNNASPVDTLQALRAGLANQPRPLRRFGVFLDQARIAAEALSSGIVKANVNMGKVADAQTKVDIATAKLAATRKKYGASSIEVAQAEITLHNASRGLTAALGGQIPKLTTAQRTLAIYRLILKDTADAHGDAARTGDAFAGQMRSLHAELGNLQEEIGTLLLPTVLKYAGALSDWLSKSKNQKSVLDAVKGAVQAFSGAMQAATALLRPLARGASGVADAVGGWKNAIALAIGAWAGLKLAGIGTAIAIQAANLVAAGVVENAWRAALISTGWGALAVAAGLAAAYIITHWQQVKVFFERLWIQLRRGALRTFADIVEPFSHLPGRMGAWARRAKENVHSQLAQLAVEAGKLGETAGSAWGTSFVRAAEKGMPAGALGPITSATAGPAGARGPAGVTAPGAMPAGAQGPVDVRGAASPADKAAANSAAAAAKAAAKAAAEAAAAVRRHRVFQERLNATPVAAPLQLQVKQARAEALNDQRAIVAAARAIRAWVLSIIRTLHGQRLISAYGLLGQANDAIAAAAKEAADKAKAQAEAAKQKLAEARRKMQEAIDNVRQQIGELFQGPILAPTEEQQKARLGAPGPKPQDLVRDLRAQTALFARFNRDLVRLQKLGAPKELIKELRAQGTAALPEIEALLGASKKIRDEFFKAFRSRERLVQRVAKVEMRAQNVNLVARNLHVSGGRLRKMAEGGIATGPTAALVGESGPEAVIPLSRLGGGSGKQEYHLYIDGREVDVAVTRQHQRRRTTTAAQVRGRHPGRTEID